VEQVLQSKLKLKEEQREAKNKSIDDQNRTNYRGRGNFQGHGGSGEDENKVEEVDSPPKTMIKQSKNKDFQEIVKKETFLEEECMKNLKFNATIIRSMVIMLQNVGIVPLTILKKRVITLKKNILFCCLLKEK